MGFLRRKLASVSSITPTGQSIPGPGKTLGHVPATTFTQAVIDRQWPSAESIFQSAPLVDQAHMISVACDTGGSPELLDEWVNQGSPLARLLRGATSIVTAWDERSGASLEGADPEVINRFHQTLSHAEADLFAATEGMPESSIPWQHLLTSGRGLSTNRVELDERYVKHIERGELLVGHLSFQQLISAKWAGSHDEMWEHAEWATRSAPAGSPKHVLVAIAMIEHHIKSDLDHGSINELPGLLGKVDVLSNAAYQCYGTEAFDATTPEAAKALSAWFTLHYLMGNWEQADALIPMIGDRFAAFPMFYFQDTSWDGLQQYVGNRLLKAA